MAFSRNSLKPSEEEAFGEQENFFMVQAVFSLAANLLLFVVLAGVPKLRRSINCFVGNLCLSSIFYTLTGCLRLAEFKGILILRGYKCLMWKMCHQIGAWVTAKMLASISLHECYKFTHINAGIWAPTLFSVITKVACSWLSATSVSFFSIISFSYNSAASLNTSCNDALHVRYPMMELWQNFMALNIFYLWNSVQLLYELIKIRWSIRDLLFCQFESRHRTECVDDSQVKRRLKQVKYIVCYSMIYLLFWAPPGISDFICSSLNIMGKGEFTVFHWMKTAYDDIRHIFVSLFPVIFLLLSCTLADMKLCFRTCFVIPFPLENHGVHNREETPTPVPAHHYYSNWTSPVGTTGTSTVTNVELSVSQHSIDIQSESQM